MLPLLFHMQNLPQSTTTTVNNVYCVLAWPKAFQYLSELIGS